MTNRSGKKRREQFTLVLGRDAEGRVVTMDLVVSDLDDNQRGVSLNGFRLPRVIGPVHQLIRDRGVTSRQWESDLPFELDQATGAQIEVLIRATKPLRRLDRLDRVVAGVTGMSPEEASYWHVQMTTRAGLRALRVLLGETK